MCVLASLDTFIEFIKDLSRLFGRVRVSSSHVYERALPNVVQFSTETAALMAAAMMTTANNSSSSSSSSSSSKQQRAGTVGGGTRQKMRKR
jgi:hypothetical protein